MNDFREGLARFRDSVRQEGERTGSPGLPFMLERARGGKSARLRWAVAAVGVLLLGAIPAYKNAQDRQREIEQEKADTLLLEQVHAGLSRSVPRALAPLMGWAPADAEKQGEDR